MTAKCIIKVYFHMAFDVLVADLTNTTIHVPRHIVLCSFSNSTVKIMDSHLSSKERRHTIATLRATRESPFESTNAQTCQTAPRH